MIIEQENPCYLIAPSCLSICPRCDTNMEVGQLIHVG